MPSKPKKKRQYKSAESRARQLAGLSSVRISDHVVGADHIQKVNGKGPLASVTPEQKKQIIELYCQGYSCRAIEEKTGISKQTVDDIKRHALDHDSQFRDKLFAINLRGKLQHAVEGVTDRVIELIPEMAPKDAALTLGIAFDKLQALDRNKQPDTLHQHVHLHAPSELSAAFMNAMKPAEQAQKQQDVIEADPAD